MITPFSGAKTEHWYVAEATAGITPTTPVWTKIRNTGFVPSLSKDPTISNELDGSRENTNVRTGSKQVTGEIPVLLSQTSQDELIAGAMTSQWVAGVTGSALDITVDDAGKTFTRAAGDFVSDGVLVGDTAYFGPEPEFFVFDDIKWGADMSGNFYKINSDEAAWSSSAEMPDGNMGHRPGVKGGYFPVPPVDSLHDLRAAMCGAMEQMGLDIEVHHHEVGTAGQCEIGVRFDTLVAKADQVQILKYCVHNVAHAYGKTATFMPKPIVGDNGSGMHCHMSFSKDGDNQFAGDAYAGLSETALYYIGGIIKHARALNAFTNGSTNSYKRLVAGFEAPVHISWARNNRSGLIRVPVPKKANPSATRIEYRSPDPACNPYLAFSVILAAGLKGIQEGYELPPEADSNLFEMGDDMLAKLGIEQLPQSMSDALRVMERSELVAEALGEHILEWFLRNKRAEWRGYKTHISQYELNRYLRSL